MRLRRTSDVGPLFHGFAASSWHLIPKVVHRFIHRVIHRRFPMVPTEMQIQPALPRSHLYQSLACQVCSGGAINPHILPWTKVGR